jgi:hypothetical protein
VSRRDTAGREIAVARRRLTQSGYFTGEGPYGPVRVAARRSRRAAPGRPQPPPRGATVAAPHLKERLMDYERELAEIERQLLTQDPHLAAELDTFGDLTAARRPPRPPVSAVPPVPAAPPRPRTARRRRRLLIAACVAVALIVIALTSALSAGAATHRPDRTPRPGHAVQEHGKSVGARG